MAITGQWIELVVAAQGGDTLKTAGGDTLQVADGNRLTVCRRIIWQQ